MFAKLLYPTDFSDVAAKALEYIKQLKESGAREVVVLHVVDERGLRSAHPLLGDHDTEHIRRRRREEIETRLRQVADELTAAGMSVKCRTEKGIAAKEILRVEAEEAVSAIVLGSHGVSNLEEILLGSVSEKVIRKCRRPVLVIKR